MGRKSHKKIKKYKLPVDDKGWYKYWQWWFEIVYGGRKGVKKWLGKKNKMNPGSNIK